ncbi:unnamed protein product [Fusarium graminearum]|nr:unnamed protein product [Fusarium graminearum]
MAVPVTISAAILFPWLLYIVFADEKLLPREFQLPNISEGQRSRVPINPILRTVEDEEALDSQSTISEGYLNPFLDAVSAWTGSLILVATIITLLVLDATGVSNGQHTVFWVALPGSFVVFCWDTYHGWHQRHLTREIIMIAKASSGVGTSSTRMVTSPPVQESLYPIATSGDCSYIHRISRATTEPQKRNTEAHGKVSLSVRRFSDPGVSTDSGTSVDRVSNLWQMREKASLQSSASKTVKWLQATFPTTMAVLATMPFEIIPFTLCMFVLVEALVNNGWVPVFALGWDSWVDRTGVVGAVAGMAFLSVIVCNFLGSSVGTTILLSQVLQRWQEMRLIQGTPLDDRTFAAAIYSLAIGANFGGSSAGLLWRRELLRRNVHVKTVEYARINFPIMIISIPVACAVLIGQVYITRDNFT